MDVNGAKALKERLGPKGADDAPPASVDVPADASPVYHWLGVGNAAADVPSGVVTPGRAVSENARAHKRSLPLVGVRTEAGSVVCERCEIADSALGRMRGLLGRDGSRPESGMLIDAAPLGAHVLHAFPDRRRVPRSQPEGRPHRPRVASLARRRSEEGRRGARAAGGRCD